VLLLCDYDGTLTPIADRPDLAVLAPETQEVLVSLSRREKYLLGIISGRSLADVCARVDIPGLIYAGNHGLEMRGPGLEFVHPEAERLRETQRHVCQRLREELADLPGVIVEDKGLTLSVHYRLAPDVVAGDVQGRLSAAISAHLDSGELKISRGKKVLEVRLNLPWDKGKAIARLQDAYPQASPTVFFGDDLTDEDGFTVVQEGGGMAVFVGPAGQPTKALYRLDSPQEVAQTLRLLVRL
jgi:trehalose-phosphatase